MGRSTLIFGNIPNKAAVFSILLDLPEVDVDAPPQPPIEKLYPFPDMILYDGHVDQLNVLVNHAKYKDEYMDKMIDYHERSNVI
jgi:hypothetical protein